MHPGDKYYNSSLSYVLLTYISEMQLHTNELLHMEQKYNYKCTQKIIQCYYKERYKTNVKYHTTLLLKSNTKTNIMLLCNVNMVNEMVVPLRRKQNLYKITVHFPFIIQN